MLMKRKLIILVALIVVLMGLCVRAAIPNQISYQGYLEDGSGPMTATAVPMTFALYETVSGGSPVWIEVLLVDVNNGLFNVILGSQPNNPIFVDLFSGWTYLGISVDIEDEMTPRQKIVSVAYAFVAEHANTANSAHFLSAPDGYPHNAVYVNNDGLVGIGMQNPLTTLDVEGAIKVGSDSTACDPSTAGTIRYNNADAVLEFCNGTEWKTLSILNRPPSQPVVEIIPGSPTSFEDLYCNIITPGIDPDGDAVSYTYAWQLNGTGTVVATTNTLSNTHTMGGEVWQCTVTPTDGKDNGDGTPGIDSVTLQNMPPTQPVVWINQPYFPCTSTMCDLQALIIEASVDPDGGPITYEYSWTKDLVIQPGLTTNLVDHSLTTKGDVWQCTVTAYDGHAYGPPGLTPELPIINSKPIIDSIVIAPRSPNPSNILIALIDSHDADGDEITSLEIYWEYKHISQGSSYWDRMDEYDDLVILPSSATSADYNFRVSARASDATEFGEWKTSGFVTVN